MKIFSRFSCLSNSLAVSWEDDHLVHLLKCLNSQVLFIGGKILQTFSTVLVSNSSLLLVGFRGFHGYPKKIGSGDIQALVFSFALQQFEARIFLLEQGCFYFNNY